MIKAIIFSQRNADTVNESASAKELAVILPTGEMVLHRLIRLLGEYGVEEILALAGERDRAEQETLASAFPKANLQWAQGQVWQGLESAAQGTTSEDTILLVDASIVLDEALVKDFLDCGKKAVLAVKKRAFATAGSAKACVDMMRVVAFTDEDTAAGKFVFMPMMKFSAEGALPLSRHLQAAASGAEQGFDWMQLNGITSALELEAFYSDAYFNEVFPEGECSAYKSHLLRISHCYQQLHIKRGAILQCKGILEQQKPERVLVVCDGTYEIFQLPYLLQKWAVPHEVWRVCGQEATIENVREGIAAFQKADCDLILSVGGSAAIETAKMIQAFAMAGSLDSSPKAEISFGYSPVKHLTVPSLSAAGSWNHGMARVAYPGHGLKTFFFDGMIPFCTVFDINLILYEDVDIRRNAYFAAVMACMALLRPIIAQSSLIAAKDSLPQYGGYRMDEDGLSVLQCLLKLIREREMAEEDIFAIFHTLGRIANKAAFIGNFQPLYLANSDVHITEHAESLARLALLWPKFRNDFQNGPILKGRDQLSVVIPGQSVQEQSTVGEISAAMDAFARQLERERQLLAKDGSRN